ncbi:uncharacterized protein [Nicotiana tomentosiformis]|uniref:uncharacterized protein n=1 Tax=Nicotiana tomentosiformis TaxID=4098 RepID=UPI00388C3E79
MQVTENSNIHVINGESTEEELATMKEAKIQEKGEEAGTTNTIGKKQIQAKNFNNLIEADKEEVTTMNARMAMKKKKKKKQNKTPKNKVKVMFKPLLSQEKAKLRRKSNRNEKISSHIGEKLLNGHDQKSSQGTINSKKEEEVERGGAHGQFSEGMKYLNKGPNDKDYEHSVTKNQRKEDVVSESNISLPSYVKNQAPINLVVDIFGQLPNAQSSQEIVEETDEENAELIINDSLNVAEHNDNHNDGDHAHRLMKEVCERNGVSPVKRGRSRQKKSSKSNKNKAEPFGEG